MDVNGLAAAWLGAVQRTRSPQPGPERPWADQDRLTDVIEQALRDGGPDSKDPDWVDPMRPGAVIDRTA